MRRKEKVVEVTRIANKTILLDKGSLDKCYRTHLASVLTNCLHLLTHLLNFKGLNLWNMQGETDRSEALWEI